jgi:cardiolipin synthase
LSWPSRFKFRLLGLTFPDTYVEDEFGDTLGRDVMEHPNVEIDWVNHTHTKYYIFDERVMLTGSINIEDRHRGYRDYMFEITGEEHVRRFRQRDAGESGFDPGRPIDFLLNRITPDRREFEIKPRIVEALSRAGESVHIEMAYIGDPDVGRAIIEAARRGVSVTVLFSREANIGDDINWHALHGICRRAPVEVAISDKMIHSKLMLVDDRQLIAGSANFSVFSMQKAAELDVVVGGMPGFLGSVRAESRRRFAASQPVESPGGLKSYNRLLAGLQQLHQWLT